jgi:hypothetical protein
LTTKGVAFERERSLEIALAWKRSAVEFGCQSEDGLSAKIWRIAVNLEIVSATTSDEFRRQVNW